MEGTNSFKERNKAMKDAPLVKRSVRLTVYDFDYFFEEKREQIKAMLTELSGLHIKIVRGALLRKKFYVYFDDIDSADAATSTIVRIAYCRTKVHKGTFDVTNLVRDNTMEKLKDLKLQPQVFFKPKFAKETNFVTNTIKSSNTEQYY
jgi:hypothetical protein